MLARLPRLHRVALDDRVGILAGEAAIDQRQQHALQSWKTRQLFLDVLLGDADVTTRLKEADLRALFDYSFYLQNIGATFTRLGL